MGLFSKKACSICGEDAGRLFTKKLEDGVLCKECTGKLSPWFSDRRSATVEQISAQLDYREANKDVVADFKVTRTFNGRYKVLLDEDAGNFCVCRNSGNWREDNPDIISFADVTGCSYEIRETKTDVTPDQDDFDHHHDGFDDPHRHGGFDEPPRHHGAFDDYDDFEGRGHSHGGPGYGNGRPGGPVYEYSYDFYMTINVNNPYFTEIEYQVNEDDIEDQRGGEYQSCESLCEEIKATLTQVREQTRSAAAPKQPVRCSSCGATTTPGADGCCEFCGSPL